MIIKTLGENWGVSPALAPSSAGLFDNINWGNATGVLTDAAKKYIDYKNSKSLLQIEREKTAQADALYRNTLDYRVSQAYSQTGGTPASSMILLGAAGIAIYFFMNRKGRK